MKFSQALGDAVSAGGSMSVGAAVHDYDSALAFLYNRVNYEQTPSIPYQSSEFKLDRMHDLMHRLGDPQLRVPSVHVAGTKGKGSTCAMLAAVLQQAGYRTGLYTSPHLDRIEERFAIDGTPCTAAQFCTLTMYLEPVVQALDAEAAKSGGRGPTFFEIITAMALLHFANEGVQIAVLEVGLGGRVDSTNICHSAVSVITSISFDHMRQLGNTLCAIATEKAGIIKPGIPVVCGETKPEPWLAIEGIAAHCGAPILQRQRDFRAVSEPNNVDTLLTDNRFAYEDLRSGRTIGELSVPLPGIHQQANAATACAALLALADLGWNISASAIRQGLQQTCCAARIELISRDPFVVLDTAHNTASALALCETLAPLGRSPRILVFATSRDKDLAGMLEILLPRFTHVVLTRYANNPRARSLEEVLPVANDVWQSLPVANRAQLHRAESAADAWHLARSLLLLSNCPTKALICITGSFFLAAELKPLLISNFTTDSLRPRESGGPQHDA